MNQPLTRRNLLPGIACMTATAALTPLMIAPVRRWNIPMGYTGITWKNDQVEDAIDTVASQGFYGFETFGDVLSNWEARGGLAPVLKAKNLSLISIAR